jgi:serine protease AprX
MQPSGGFRLHLTFFFAALVALASSSADGVECFTPRAWQPKLTNTPRDLNHNFIEDSLEGRSGTVDVVLDLNDCADSADVQHFASRGSVELVGRFLSFIVLHGVNVADLPVLAADPLVAFVEEDGDDFLMRATSRSTIGADRVTSTYGFDGKGVNVAIIDSGVDDGVQGALPSDVFVGGYNAVSKKFENPDDDNGHGTLVASIALGRPVASSTICDGVPSGIAPGAGLIDIRITDKSGGISKSSVLRALETVIEKRVEWSIRVANMSFGDCKASNGTDVQSSCVNRLVADGIVVTIAAGNTPNCGLKDAGRLIESPAAADDGIAVASSDEHDDADRSNDTISTFSVRGPRDSDNDSDPEDEQKPDLAAPGTNITAAKFNASCGTITDSGTSYASPHVAGCAALLIQALPTISPQSLKRLLLDTAEGRPEAGWNSAWGHGLLDCFRAVDQLVKNTRSDVKFETYVNKPDVDWWFSPDVFPEAPLVEKQPNVIHAVITNGGPAVADPVVVRLGVYNFSNGDLEYSICTVPLPGPLASGKQAEVTCPYTPAISGKPPGTVHACLKAEIVYPYDTDSANNRAQHNVDIKQAKSPAVFNVRVVNPTRLDLVMHLRERFVSGSGWQLIKHADDFLLRADECPRTVTMDLVPSAGATRSVVVSVAIGGTPPSGHDIPLGGVVLNGVRAECLPIAISPASLPGATAGAPYNRIITATGGSAPLTFTLAAGSLPPGVTLGADGTLSGIPATTGPSCFTIVVTDSAGCSSSSPQDYSIIVSGPACTPGTSITLAPAVLPIPILNKPYSQSIAASGGTPPYSFSILSGGLPPGLTLNSTSGVISGTPTTQGVFRFTIAATDANGCVGSMGCESVMSLDIPLLSPAATVMLLFLLAAWGMSASRIRIG